MGKDKTGLASQPPLLSTPAFPEARREQRARRALLDEACTSHRRQGEGPRRLLNASDLRHLVVDDRHRLLYCYVPKVACTNWKRVLLVLAGQAAQPLDIPAGRAHVVGAFRTLDSFTPAEINRRLRTYLKFLFVREPFERLVSAYRNKFTRAYNTAFHRRYGTRIIRRHRRHPSARALRHGADVTFAEFVWYLTDPRTRRDGPFNEHWDTIHSLCHPCLIRYDVLGRYETLERDAHYLLSLTTPQHPVTFPRSSRSVTTTSVAAAYFRNISPFYQRKLFQLYRLDFTLFNYSAPAYLNMVDQSPSSPLPAELEQRAMGQDGLDGPSSQPLSSCELASTAIIMLQPMIWSSNVSHVSDVDLPHGNCSQSPLSTPCPTLSSSASPLI